MKRILYFHHGGALSGSALSLFYLIRGLPNSQFEAHVCCLRSGAVVKHFTEHGIIAYADSRLSCFGHVNGGWYPLNSLRSMAHAVIDLLKFIPTVLYTIKIIRRERPDIVHLNTSVLTPQAVGCKLAGVPFIWHLREAAHPGHFGLRRFLLRSMFRSLPTRVVSICNANAEALRVPESKRRVIYNFVDTRRFSGLIDGGAVRQYYGIPDGKRVILYCGGTSEIKGGGVVPAALERLKELFPNFVCLVSGHMTPDGLSLARRDEILRDDRSPIAQSWKAFHALVVEGHAIVTGFRVDVEQLIAACDCLIFPSTCAHFARPVIEAACMGKPVVASRFPEVEEVVADGKTGVLVPAGDFNALACELAKLLRDDSRMKEMGKAAFDVAIGRFDASVNIRQTIAVYEEVIGAKRR